MDPQAMLSEMGWAAKLSLLVGLLPLAMGLAYAIWPSERRLAGMRPISLAAIFGAIGGTVSGFVNILAGIAATPELSSTSRMRIAAGASEALVPIVFAFACLAVGWLLVAIGMARGTSDA